MSAFQSLGWPTEHFSYVQTSRGEKYELNMTQNDGFQLVKKAKHKIAWHISLLFRFYSFCFFCLFNFLILSIIVDGIFKRQKFPKDKQDVSACKKHKMSNGKIFKCVQTYQIKLTRYSNYVACNHINKIAECRTNRYNYISTKGKNRHRERERERKRKKVGRLNDRIRGYSTHIGT